MSEIIERAIPFRPRRFATRQRSRDSAGASPRKVPAVAKGSKPKLARGPPVAWHLIEPPVRVFERFKPAVALKKFEGRTRPAPEALPQRVTHHSGFPRSDLSHLFSLIFEQGCSFEQLRAAAPVVLAGVGGLRQLTDELCVKHIRPFMDSFESLVSLRINRVSEIVEEGPPKRRVFRSFNRCMKTYVRLVEMIQQQFNNLERIYIQVQELIKFYCARLRPGEELDSQYLHESLMFAWRIGSEDMKQLLAHLNSYFERKTNSKASSSFEETLMKVTQFLIILDPSSIGALDQAPSETHAGESGVPSGPTLPNSESLICSRETEPLDPIPDEPEVQTAERKKRKNKKKRGEKEKVRELQVQLQELAIRNFQLQRQRATVVFSSEEKRVLESFTLDLKTSTY